MRKYLLVLLCLLLVSGCDNPLQKENEVETEVTEAPTPDIILDTSKQVSNSEMTLTFTTFDSTVIGVTGDDEIRVYENSESFNSAYIAMAYMPNYKRLEDMVDTIVFKELGNGYVAVITDEGIGVDMCKKIATHIVGSQ